MVRDYEVKWVAAHMVLDPEIGQMFDGTRWHLAATRLDEARLSFWLAFEWRDVLQPVPDFVTSLAGSDEKITIQLPTWTEFGFEDRCAVGSGDAVLWLIPGQSDGDPVVIALPRLLPVR